MVYMVRRMVLTVLGRIFFFKSSDFRRNFITHTFFCKDMIIVILPEPKYFHKFRI